MDDPLERRLYERAVFGRDASGLDEAERHLSAVEADLALACGRVLHARFLDATSRTLEAGADLADEPSPRFTPRGIRAKRAARRARCSVMETCSGPA